MLTIDGIRRALAQPRPGWAGQAKMIPRSRPGTQFPPPPPNAGKQAGVLLLLYPNAAELDFILTRRTQTVATHKGQISFPGGMREGDETLEQTALRETREELGIDHAQIEILGAPLTPTFIPVSEFWVTAFVGYTRQNLEFVLQPDEVVEILQVPLRVLLDDATVQEEDWVIRATPVRVPFFNLSGHKVWGATAMMLSEFKELVRRGENNGIS